MALSANRNTAIMGAGGVPVVTSYPVAASTHIYEGSIVCLDSSGNAVAANTSTGVVTVGIAVKEADNSSGAAAAINVQVMQGVAHVGNHSSLTKSRVGTLVYVYDDASVQSTGSIVAGTVYLVDSSGIWVYMGLDGPIDGSALTTFESALASTANGDGASLVGVEDAGGFYSGADVEAVLAELGNPKAVISCPIPAYADIADAAVLMRITPGFIGRISKIVVQATTAVTTAAKGSTLTAKIAGTTVTGAAVAMTSAGQNAIGASQSASATGANTFTAAQEITVVASSTTAFVEGAGVIYLVLA